MSEPSYLGALDQGTTSTRFLILDRAGHIVASAQQEHRQIYPRPGWVEHDAMEILARTRSVIDEAVSRSGLDAGQIAAVGITNQRETTVVWEKSTGKPVYNAIVWQDTRTQRIVEELGGSEGAEKYKHQVGLPLATYFSGPKD